MRLDGRKNPPGIKFSGRCVALVFTLLIVPLIVSADQEDYGYVKITSDALDANLYVDGAYIGQLSAADSFRLPVGKHLLSFLSGSVTGKLYPISEIPITMTTETSISTRKDPIDTSRITTETSIETGPAITDNERRIIESASYWIYIQPEKTISLFMDRSKYTSTIEASKDEDEALKRRKRNRLLILGGGAAVLITAVLIGASMQ